MNRPLSLSEHFAKFVDNQVDAGRYASADEVVEAGLRLLEEQQAKLVVLREAIDEGDRSGRIRNFDAKAFLANMNRAHET